MEVRKVRKGGTLRTVLGGRGSHPSVPEDGVILYTYSTYDAQYTYYIGTLGMDILEIRYAERKQHGTIGRSHWKAYRRI